MSLLRVIYDSLISVLDEGAYSNLVLKDGMGGLEENKRRIVKATVSITLENLNYIDYLIAHYAKGKVDKRVKFVLRIGFARCLFMRVPQGAVCNDAVNLTREVGKSALSGYVNAVMRALCRDINSNLVPKLPDDMLLASSIEFGYPAFLVQEYFERFGVEAGRAIMAYKNPGMSIRAQYPYTADELEAELERQGVSFRRGSLVRDIFKLDCGFNPSKNELFVEGKITVQSESSALACLCLEARAGQRVLDACAAPGGKSAFIASLTQGECDILAWDVHPHRLELMQKTFARMRVKNVLASVHDATLPIPEYIEAFDCVLIDAPCSGLGVVNKPEIRLKTTLEGIDELAVIQKRLLDVCSKYVKPGGTLVYSTCTISVRENENIINSFLNENDFIPSKPKYLPKPLNERVSSGMLTLRPDLDDTEGFFIARLTRK